jgi:hypothetical protein
MPVALEESKSKIRIKSKTRVDESKGPWKWSLATAMTHQCHCRYLITFRRVVQYVETTKLFRMEVIGLTFKNHGFGPDFTKLYRRKSTGNIVCVERNAQVRASNHKHMKPHRGTLILVLGILSLVACGIFTGVPAWIMGNNDLKAMAAGTMDPSGRSLTNAGRICGMICTILSILAVALVIVFLALGRSLPMSG